MSVLSPTSPGPSLGTRVVNLLRRRLVQNVLTLSGVDFVMYALPLVTVPYLVRVLGVDAWGTLAFYQSFAIILSQVIEFGFKWSGTRDVAQNRKEPAELSKILAGVLGGKAILVIVGVVAAILLASMVPALGRSSLLLSLALLWASGLGLNVIWFYHGLERMRLAAGLTASSKLIATIGVFVLVRSPEDAWKVLLLYAGAAWIASLMGLLLIHRSIPFQRPTFALGIATLRPAVTFFIFNSAVSFYTIANVFILGLFASPRIVGYYAGAEKISKALLMLLTPVSRALYPRVSYLAQSARERAADLVRLEMKILVAGAVAMSAGAIFFAPLIVRIILGGEFGRSVPIVQLGALLPLIIVPNLVLGTHWMISLGLERPYLKIVLAAGVLNFSLAILMAPRYGAIGMMLAVVITEVFVTTTVVTWLWRRHMDPFRYVTRLTEQGA